MNGEEGAAMEGDRSDDDEDSTFKKMLRSWFDPLNFVCIARKKIPH